LKEGVFYSKLICQDGIKQMTVDARTSDAIALALRFRCSIFTTEEILSKSGIVIDIEPESKENKPPHLRNFFPTCPRAGNRAKNSVISASAN
jgi:bifunctional DNase/RNase